MSRTGLLAERYLAAARTAGCPEDQIRNFLRANIVLQPQQLLASAAARLCDPGCTHHEDDPCTEACAPRKIGYGGARGGGKSHWGLTQIACDDCQRFAGLKFLYLRKVGKAGKEAVQDLRRDVLHSTPHTYRQQDGLLLFPNGSRIILGHFQNDRDIDSYLGLQYDGALIEEATQLSSSKVDNIATCVRTSKAGWRPRMYYTTNPGNIGHAWFKALFIVPLREGRERETRFVQATVRDNRFVNREYRRELENLTGWQRAAWLDGSWDIAAGQFFTTWRYDVHTCEPFELPAGWRTWCSLDYGFTHYTAVYLLAEDGDGTVYLADEHGARSWLPERHAGAVKAMLARNERDLGDLHTFVAGADVFAKKGGRTIAQDYAEEGIRLKAANDDRIQGAGEILSRLGDVEATDPEGEPKPILPRLKVFRRCGRFIENLPSLQHDPHRPEDVLKVDVDERGLGGDDWYDAARYGIMAAYRRKLTFN